MLLDSSWTKEETDRLWNLCERFQLKFIVIQDRFNEGKKGFDVKTVEEIKERYFDIVAKLQSIRGSNSSRFIYDKGINSILVCSYCTQYNQRLLVPLFV